MSEISEDLKYEQGVHYKWYHGLWGFYIIFCEISTEYLGRLYVNGTKRLNENVFCIDI